MVNTRFLRNTWYAAGWAADIGQEPVARTIIDEPVLLYRTEQGEVVALSNICPHRFAALNLGKLVHDQIECAYHGLRFDSRGVCVHNPHGPIIPDKARLRKFPVLQCDGLVWVWMGPDDEADERKITRFPELNRPDHFTYTRGITMEMPLSYELITDNLMDLSHTAFIHADTLGSECLVPGETATRHDGEAIWSDRVGINGTPPRAFWETGACRRDERIDYWIDIRWTPPATFFIYGGVTPTGTPRENGSELSSVQILTPASEGVTYYFIKHLRDYERDNVEMTKVMEQVIRNAFANEDEPMIASVTDNMMGREFWSMRPVILPCDNAAVRVRRKREQMIREENF